MTRSALTALVALAVATGAASSFAQSTNDHLLCFKVNDSAPPAKYRTTITNAGGSQVCTVKTPARLACVESATAGVTPTPPGGGPSGMPAGGFMCYVARCAKPSASVNVQDQFGTRLIKFRGSQLLCAPADVTAPPPGVSTTTTTTLPSQNPCRFESGECRGTCGTGQRCGAAVGTGSCECREVACGDADAPDCNGACSNPSEACVFNLSGCSCVRIP